MYIIRIDRKEQLMECGCVFLSTYNVDWHLLGLPDDTSAFQYKVRMKHLAISMNECQWMNEWKNEWNQIRI